MFNIYTVIFFELKKINNFQAINKEKESAVKDGIKYCINAMLWEYEIDEIDKEWKKKKIGREDYDTYYSLSIGKVSDCVKKWLELKRQWENVKNILDDEDLKSEFVFLRNQLKKEVNDIFSSIKRYIKEEYEEERDLNEGQK